MCNKTLSICKKRIPKAFGVLHHPNSNVQRVNKNAQLHKTENNDAADPIIFVNAYNFLSAKMSLASPSTAAAMDSWTTEEKLELASLAAKVRTACCSFTVTIAITVRISNWQKSQVCRFSDCCLADFGPRSACKSAAQHPKTIRTLDVCQ